MIIWPYPAAINLRCGFVGKRYQDCDQTIEILMNDLDDDVMKTFYKKNTTTAELATKVSSLKKTATVTNILKPYNWCFNFQYKKTL